VNPLYTSRFFPFDRGISASKAYPGTDMIALLKKHGSLLHLGMGASLTILGKPPPQFSPVRVAVYSFRSENAFVSMPGFAASDRSHLRVSPHPFSAFRHSSPLKTFLFELFFIREDDFPLASSSWRGLRQLAVRSSVDRSVVNLSPFSPRPYQGGFFVLA